MSFLDNFAPCVVERFTHQKSKIFGITQRLLKPELQNGGEFVGHPMRQIGALFHFAAQYGFKEPLLVGEVAINERLVVAGSRGNGLHPRPVEPALGKLRNRCLKNGVT